jgi:hypothetical protein
MYNEQGLESNVFLITTPQKGVGDSLHVYTHYDKPTNLYTKVTSIYLPNTNLVNNF